MASSSTPATPLLYACIAHNSTILAEHTTSAASNASSLASLLLPKISHATPQKASYTHNDHFIHYISSAPSEYADEDDAASAGGLVFLVVAASSVGRRVPFGFLVEIRRRFLAAFPPAGRSGGGGGGGSSTDFAAMPTYGAASFNGELRRLMVEYGTTAAGRDDALHNVQQEIESVRDIMTENIERVLERGERIDLLVDKTDRLGGSAHEFRVRSRGLRRRMWWKNVKLMAMLAVVVVFLVYLFVGFGCGLPAWGKCFG